jgi:hypothetical protein
MAIGTTAAILGGTAALSAGASIIGGNKAAKSQRKAADASLELQREMFDQTRADLAPFMGAGSNALAALEYDMGLRTDRVNLTPDVKMPGVKRGDATFSVLGESFKTRDEAKKYLNEYLKAPSTGGFGGDIARSLGADYSAKIEKTPGGWMTGNRRFDTEAEAQAAAERRFERNGGKFYEGYQQSPGYEFRLQEGVDAIDASGAAAGNLFSGATLKRLNRFGQDFATADYTNHLNRLFNLSGSGQNAAAGLGSLGANFAAQGSNALANAGNAQAAGAINTTNAINGFLGNAVGAFGFGGGGSGAGGFSPPPMAVNRAPGTGMLTGLPGFPS